MSALKPPDQKPKLPPPPKGLYYAFMVIDWIFIVFIGIATGTSLALGNIGSAIVYGFLLYILAYQNKRMRQRYRNGQNNERED